MKYNKKKKSKDKPKGRKVMNTHSIIIIKNEKNEYLQYYDIKWNCYLFLNSKMKNKEDMESIYNKIKEKGWGLWTSRLCINYFCFFFI